MDIISYRQLSRYFKSSFSPSYTPDFQNVIYLFFLPLHFLFFFIKSDNYSVHQSDKIIYLHSIFMKSISSFFSFTHSTFFFNL